MIYNVIVIIFIKPDSINSVDLNMMTHSAGGVENYKEI